MPNLAGVGGAVFYNSANAFLVMDVNDGEFFTNTIDGVVTLKSSPGTPLNGFACFDHHLFAVSGTNSVVIEMDANGNMINTTMITMPGFTVNSGASITVNPATGQFYVLLNTAETPNVLKLATIDVTTGNATFIGNADNGTGLYINSIAFHPADPSC